MNTEAAIATRIATRPGIVAVRVQHVATKRSDIVVNGDPSDEAPARDYETRIALETSLEMYQAYGNVGTLRIVRGEKGPDAVTIGCFVEGDYVASVMVKTGHPISKSLRRLVGRAFAANLVSAS